VSDERFDRRGLAVLATVGGLGVAAFHPEAARWANYASRGQRGRGMSFFSLGGNAGFALGPLLVTPAVLAFGLHGTLLAVIPLWLIAVIPIPAFLLAMTLPPTEVDRELARSVRQFTQAESNDDQVPVLSQAATEGHSARHGDPPRDA
jgi:MFS family permease